MDTASRKVLLNFITGMLITILFIAAPINLVFTKLYLLSFVEFFFLLLSLYAFYLCKVKQEYNSPAWIVSTIIGILLFFVILTGQGERGEVVLILTFPVVVYPLLGPKNGTYAYLTFSFIIILTTLYGVQSLALKYPYLVLLNTILALFVGGVSIYYTEKYVKRLLDISHKNSITDPLTGLWNRKMSDNMLDRVTNESKRYDKSYSMILLDIDFFKKINDTCGHQVGDEILVEFAKIVKENTRKSDMLFRWGGEEFLIILPNTNLNGAAIAADKILKNVRCHEYSNIPEGRMTVSAGVAENTDSLDKDSFFKLVDSALYQAKNEGRDRYILAH